MIPNGAEPRHHTFRSDVYCLVPYPLPPSPYRNHGVSGNFSTRSLILKDLGGKVFWNKDLETCFKVSQIKFSPIRKGCGLSAPISSSLVLFYQFRWRPRHVFQLYFPSLFIELPGKVPMRGVDTMLGVATDKRVRRHVVCGATIIVGGRGRPALQQRPTLWGCAATWERRDSSHVRLSGSFAPPPDP